MLYEQIDARSFRLTDESSHDQQVFQFREKFSVWQVKQMGLFYSELTESCTKMGATVISTLLGMVNAAQTKSFEPIAKSFELLSKNTLGDIAIAGSGELMKFLCTGTNLERLAAVLFLKPNEKSLSEEQFRDRIVLFENQIQLEFIWEGAKDFFGKKLESLGITLSLLKTSVKRKIELATQTLDNSTGTSASGTDTSMPSPKDIPNESITS